MSSPGFWMATFNPSIAPQQSGRAGYLSDINRQYCWTSWSSGIRTFAAGWSRSAFKSTLLPNLNHTEQDDGITPNMKHRNLLPPLDLNQVKTRPKQEVEVRRRCLPIFRSNFRIVLPCGVWVENIGWKTWSNKSNPALWKPQSWIRLSSCPAWKTSQKMEVEGSWRDLRRIVPDAARRQSNVWNWRFAMALTMDWFSCSYIITSTSMRIIFSLWSSWSSSSSET